MYTTRNKLEACHVDDPQIVILVSVLDLDSTAASCDPPGIRAYGSHPVVATSTTSSADVLSKRCQFPSDRTSKHCVSAC